MTKTAHAIRKTIELFNRDVIEASNIKSDVHPVKEV